MKQAVNSPCLVMLQWSLALPQSQNCCVLGLGAKLLAPDSFDQQEIVHLQGVILAAAGAECIQACSAEGSMDAFCAWKAAFQQARRSIYARGSSDLCCRGYGLYEQRC